METKERLQAIYVDDEPTFLQVFGEIIRENGVDLVTFDNPMDAIEELKNHPTKYSIIITDYRMPEMNGFSFLKKLEEENYFGIKHMAIFSSMVCDSNFIEEFNLRFKDSKSPISLLDKPISDEPEELKAFLHKAQELSFEQKGA